MTTAFNISINFIPIKSDLLLLFLTVTNGL